MNGHASPFDVGIAFGTPGKGKDLVTGPVQFTLDAVNDITLDDFAHLQFGARTTSFGDKITTFAPAAPDAQDDAFSIFEDGASGVDDPSTSPTGVLLNVLANDTDADNDKLVITGDFHDGPLHGTVQVVDGDDTDSDPGDAILYTPFEDYSGTDSFTYCVSDGNGGQDSATVNVTITAVADTPDLSYEVLSGTPVDKIVLRVTATQTDFDSSESSIGWSGASRAGCRRASASCLSDSIPEPSPTRSCRISRSRFRSDRIRTSI
jgi:Bacterial Ig domain